jgi:phosphoglycerol transferase MdoB-like AlkP superfamily enzyme
VNLDSFWYGILVVAALLFFGWRLSKSLKAIKAARAAKKSAPLIEWLYIVMGLFLASLFILNALGLINA